MCSAISAVKDMKTFSIHTFGCKVNQYEEEKLRRFLISRGLREEEKADISFVNTCTVTHLADRKARQKIRQLYGDNKLIIVIGCATRNPESFKELEKKDNVIFLSHKDFYGELEGIIPPCFEIATIQGTGTELQNSPREFNNSKPVPLQFQNPVPQSRTRAFVRVQDGCNQFCSYCIVPYVRGDIKSRTVKDIMEEIKELEAAGFKEIVITGVNLGLYGKDLKDKTDFTDLLIAICKNSNIPRVRISSIEVNHFNDKLMDFIKKQKRICPHFHIPLQHASDKILTLMNRSYNLEHYNKTISLLINQIPDCAISTDILTGFPGESEEDFKILCNYIKEAPFSRLHIFKYSERPLTKAKDFKNKVPESAKSERSKILTKLADKKLKSYNNSFAGRVLKVLVEDAEHKTGYMQGYTPNYIQVLIKPDKKLANKIAPAELYKKDGLVFGRIRLQRKKTMTNDK